MNDMISIHAPLAGRDSGWRKYKWQIKAFQSTRPLRGATGFYVGCAGNNAFQSTRPLRGATIHS